MVTWLPLLALLSAAPAPAVQCEFTAERTATLPVNGVELVRIGARAGNLRVEGRPGLREVRARGTACAWSRQALEATRIRVERTGDQGSLIVEVPEMGGDDGYAMLSLVIEVPEGLALEVMDSSGDIEMERVGALKLTDSSGNIWVRDVRGSLDIEDSSGNVDIDEVSGDVRLSDSSGDLTVRTVEGSVLVEEDSSGNIDISQVRGNASVRLDSSGDIRVATIRGDFTVDRDASGSIRYRDVDGRVRLPAER